VVAHLIFDTVQAVANIGWPRLTELRNKVAELIAGPAILVNFESKGRRASAWGKVGEALAAYRQPDRASPQGSGPSSADGQCLLEAGMGEAARRRSPARPSSLNPNSALGREDSSLRPETRPGGPQSAPRQRSQWRR